MQTGVFKLEEAHKRKHNNKPPHQHPTNTQKKKRALTPNQHAIKQVMLMLKKAISLVRWTLHAVKEDNSTDS